MIPPYPGVSFWKVEAKEQTQYSAVLRRRRCLDINRLPETSSKIQTFFANYWNWFNLC
jgi:hypothetical protein